MFFIIWDSSEIGYVFHLIISKIKDENGWNLKLGPSAENSSLSNNGDKFNVFVLEYARCEIEL